MSGCEIQIHMLYEEALALIHELEATNQALEQKIEYLEKDLSELQEEFNNLKEDFDNSTEEVSRLEDCLEDRDCTICDLESEIEDLIDGKNKIEHLMQELGRELEAYSLAEDGEA